MRFSPFQRWRGTPRHRNKKSARSISGHTRKLRMEQLETREMLSVSLGAINNVQVPGGKSVRVPLTGADSLGGPITYSISSSNGNVQTSLVSTTSKSLVLNVSGKDSSNNPFSGQ